MFLHVDSEDLSLRWVQSLYWFCNVAAHLSEYLGKQRERIKDDKNLQITAGLFTYVNKV